MALTTTQKSEIHDTLIASAASIESASNSAIAKFNQYAYDENSNVNDPIFESDMAAAVIHDGGRQALLNQAAALRWLAGQFA